MGFWKAFCTCAGCAVGLACIALTGGAATPLVTAAVIGIGGFAGHGVGHKIEQEEKKTKNQEQTIANQTKSIDNLTKGNEKLQNQETKENQKLEELDDRIENRDKEIEEVTKKTKDSSLSEEDRRKAKSRLKILLEEQENDKKERNSIINTIKQIKEQIANNNKSITSIGSSSSKKDKKDLWEFITLENILIVVAIYALWQIVRDSNRR